MKTARIISLIASTFYALLTIYFLSLILKTGSIFEDASVVVSPFRFYALLAMPFCLVLGALSFYFYLRDKERKDKIVKHAKIISLLLLIAPIVLYFFINIILLVLSLE